MADIPPPNTNAAPPVPTTPTAGKAAEPVQPKNKPKPQQQQQPQAKAGKKVFRNTSVHAVGKGNLCLFQYLFYKHDAYPMVLVTSRYDDGKVAGLNLHYLTFKYVKTLLKMYCNKGAFSYQNIKGNQYIVNSFRTYKQDGIRNVRMIDCEFLIQILGRIRSFNPNEVAAMREEVERQLGRVVNPSADDVSHEQIWPGDYEYTAARDSGRYNPTNITSIEE